jgi:hypothetical protein
MTELRAANDIPAVAGATLRGPQVALTAEPLRHPRHMLEDTRREVREALALPATYLATLRPAGG